MMSRDRTGIGRLLLAAGTATIAAGVLVDWSSGWLRLFLLVTGAAALVASPAGVRAYGRSVLDESRRQSPALGRLLDRRPSTYVLYSLWFALVISLSEIAYWTYKNVSLNTVRGFHYLLWIPLGYALLFACVALACVIVASRWPHRVSARVLIFTCAFIAASGLLFLVNELHDLAAAILAAGVALEVARRSEQHSYLVHRLVGRTLPGLAVVTVGLAAGFVIGPQIAESRATRQLPPAASPGPNVLLIVLDTVGAKHMSLYGYGRETTPQLDRFAKRGVVFERAFSTSPWTLPSHGSMFTGRFPRELTADWMRPIDGMHPTVAEAFSRLGYATAGFVANLTYCGREFGLARGFTHYEDHRLSTVKALTTTSFGGVLVKTSTLQKQFATHDNFGLKSAEELNDEFLRWLSKRDAARPFFAFLNYYDAHAPYQPPDEFARKFSATPPRGDIWSRKLDAWSPAEIRELGDAYDSEIAYLDDQIGRLIAELDRRGALDDTVVVVTSDHGEQFGEYGLLEHGNSLYSALLHVPLIVVHPARVPAGRRISDPVSLSSLAATILDLASQPNAAGIPGTPLATLWKPASTPNAVTPVLLAETQPAYDAYPDSYPARKGRMKSIIFREMQYIKNYGNGREELYRVTVDATDAPDLASSEPALLNESRALLQSILTNPRR
jgi:arylsulfatase A-like enzyme